MALDFTSLREYADGAFRETEELLRQLDARLVALETPDPDPEPLPPLFGNLRPAPFPESQGRTLIVSTLSELNQARNAAIPGDTIVCRGLIDATSQINVDLARPGTPDNPITLTGENGAVLRGRLLPKTDWWRIRGSLEGEAPGARFTIEAPRYNCIKFADGSDANPKPAHHWEVEGMLLTINPILTPNESPILSGFSPSSDIRVRRTIIDGRKVAGSSLGPHGAYTGGPTADWYFENLLIFGIGGFPLHFYPSINRARWVCCTLVGMGAAGDRGGVAYGSSTTDIVGVGNIVTDSKVGAFEYRGGPGTRTDDTLLWANIQGTDGDGYTPMPGTNLVTADPRYVNPAAGDYQLQPGSPAVGLIREANYGWVPPRDILGRPRLTADAGAFASQ